MKLSKITILALRGLDREAKLKLAEDMNITENTFYRWVALNDDSLTKAGNMIAIRKALGLKEDADLLEEVQAVA